MDMDLATFLELADAYAGLGNAVQDQLKEVAAAYLQGDESLEEVVAEQNVNALGYARNLLQKIDRLSSGDAALEAQELDEKLEELDIRSLGW